VNSKSSPIEQLRLRVGERLKKNEISFDRAFLLMRAIEHYTKASDGSAESTHTIDDLRSVIEANE
jgi:hypothetical protein